MPWRLNKRRSFDFLKRVNSAVYRQATPQKQQASVSDDNLQDLAIFSQFTVACFVFITCQNTTLRALGLTMQSDKAMRFIGQSPRCLDQPVARELAFKSMIGTIINTVENVVEIRRQAAAREDVGQQLNRPL